MNTNKKLGVFALIGTLLISIMGAVSAFAQAEGDLGLRLSRDFGYSSGTGQIEGTFSMHASGPDDLVRVEFLIDGQIIAEDTEAPFRYQFNTGQYELGVHTISAAGYTSSGSQLLSPSIERQFVDPEQGMQAAGRIILPLLGVVLGVFLISFVLPLVLDMRKTQTLPLGTPRNYSLLGGVICPKCGRPFARKIYGLNLAVGRLERCPHCGKWSMTRRASLPDLRAAEAAELEDARQGALQVEMTEEERLRKELEESRYQDI